DTYHDMELQNMVYSAKSKQDVFLRMADVMTDAEFERYKRNILQIEQSQGDLDEETTKEILASMNGWSFLHYLSFLVYHPSFSRLHLQEMNSLESYLPEE